MKTKSILLTVLSILVLMSCNYLDYDETNGLKTKEDIYKYFGQTKQMLTNIYGYLPQDLGTIEYAMRDCASDDAEHGATGAIIQDFTNGNWSPVHTIDEQWTTMYSGIRAANGFLVEIANTDFSRYKHDESYAIWMDQLQYFPYEARILRAFYLFELARRYGDIAMPLTVLTAEEANSIPKTSFDVVINFIVDECNQCAGNLPETYATVSGSEIGRITKGFAMALKSKALLYAASELHNSTMDKGKWKVSAQAAWDLIQTDTYQLSQEETANNLSSKEAVLFRLNKDDIGFELYNFPIRFTEGQRTGATGAFPSQNLVDAFETINGYSVILTSNGWQCEDPEFNAKQPYENRDPRLKRAVLTDGAVFKGSIIETFIGGADDVPVSAGGSPTGYFLRKYIQETTNFAPDQTVANKHFWVIYRYAETLLTYAESMVEAFDNPTYVDQTFTLSALDALNRVRNNAGMPNVTVTDKNDFIQKIRNEWRVEFAFEDHRFWDIRRWKIGSDTQKELYGVSIDKQGDNSKTYQRILYKTRKWNEQMYLYPIPQAEIFKNPNLLPQNNGWN